MENFIIRSASSSQNGVFLGYWQGFSFRHWKSRMPCFCRRRRQTGTTVKCVIVVVFSSVLFSARYATARVDSLYVRNTAILKGKVSVYTVRYEQLWDAMAGKSQA